MNIIWRLAWRNLWRHPRRTWLTAGAMVFSNILLVFLISIQFGMYDLMIENTLKTFTGLMQVQAPGYKDEMKMRQVVPDALTLANRIRTQLGDAAVATRGSAFALASSEDRTFGIQVVGVQPDYEIAVSNIPGLIKTGSFLGANHAAEIAVGSVLARNLQVGVGDKLTLLGSGRDGSFAAGVVTVVGIFESGVSELDRNIAELPLGYFQELFFMENAAHHIVISMGDLSSTDTVKQSVEAMLPKAVDLVVHDWNALQPGLRQAIQADMSSAFFMYGILVVLVAFSVLNTQLMSALERTHEFGVTMALGLTPGSLGRLLLLETAFMGLIGLVLGAAMGGLITLWFNVHGFSYPGMDEMAANFNLPAQFFPQVTAKSLFAGPLVVFSITLLAALYPALRLHRLQPVIAMRAAR